MDSEPQALTAETIRYFADKPGFSLAEVSQFGVAFDFFGDVCGCSTERGCPCKGKRSLWDDLVGRRAGQLYAPWRSLAPRRRALFQGHRNSTKQSLLSAIEHRRGALLWCAWRWLLCCLLSRSTCTTGWPCRGATGTPSQARNLRAKMR